MNKKHEWFALIFAGVVIFVVLSGLVYPLLDRLLWKQELIAFVLLQKVLGVIILIPFIWGFFVLYWRYSMPKKAKFVSGIAAGVSALLLVPLAGTSPNIITWVFVLSVFLGGVVMMNLYIWLFSDEFYLHIGISNIVANNPDELRLPKFTRKYLILPSLRDITVDK